MLGSKIPHNSLESAVFPGNVFPMEQTSADQFTVPTPKKRGPKPRTRPTLPGETQFLPAMPTSGADLMAQWALPTAAWTDGRLKITRKRPMTSELELVGERSIQDYDLAGLAAELGPGDYILVLSAQPQQLWPAHNCKVSVSAQYAAANGFQTYQTQQLPRISDVRAMQETADAMQQDRPLTVGNLAALMETITEKAVKAALEARPAPVHMGGGMDMAGMMTVFDTLSRIQKAGEDRALALMSAREPEPAEIADSGWVSLLPTLVSTLTSAFAPKPQQVTAAPLASTLAAPPAEEPMEISVPLTSGELAKFAPAVAMLRPFVPMILQGMDKTDDMAGLGAEFAQYVPGPLASQLAGLHELTVARGPAVLGCIAPALATTRGAALVAAIAEHL